MDRVTTVLGEGKMSFPPRQQPTEKDFEDAPVANVGMSPRGTPGHPAYSRVAAAIRDRNRARTSAAVEEVTATPPPAETAKRSISETDSRYITVTDLPSGFVFYNFRQLSVRTIYAAEQAKINRAMADESIRHMVDAISATLGDNVSAYALTPQDFRFLQYWHRFNSYTKVPYAHEDVCQDVGHLEKVAEGKLDADTLKISSVLTATDVNVVNLTLPENIIFDHTILDSLNVEVSVSTMQDAVDQLDLLQKVVDENPKDVGLREEYEWLSDFACYLGPKAVPFLQRVEAVRHLTADQIQELQDYIDTVGAYGVQETATITCKVCGASRKARISVDALSFLPTAQRAKSA